MVEETATPYSKQRWEGGIPMRTYYDKYGRAFPPLPADPYSISHYAERGLSLPPPESPARVPSVPATVLMTQQRSGATAERANELTVAPAPPRKRRAKKGKK